MVRLFIRNYYLRFPLLLWSCLALSINVLLLFSSVDVNNKLFSNLIVFGIKIPILSDPVRLLDTYIFLVALELLILFIEPFLDNIKSERISIILSSNISRIEFLNKNIYSMFAILTAYNTFLSLITIAVLKIKFGYFSLQIMSGLFLIPIVLIGFFVITVFINIAFNNASVSFVVVLVYIFFSGLLSSIETTNDTLSALLDILRLITPRIIELKKIIIDQNFENLKYLLSVLISFLPMLALTYYTFNKREF